MSISESEGIPGLVTEIKVVCPNCGSETLLTRSGEIGGTGLGSMFLATNIGYVVCKNCLHTPMRLYISRDAMTEDEYAHRVSYHGWRPTE